MNKRSTQTKGNKNPDIRKLLSVETRSLRSRSMAGTNEMEANTNSAENTAMLQSLAKMEEGINAQLTEMRKKMDDNYTDVKNSLAKTDDNILKVMTSFESFSSDIKTLSESNKKLEIEQIKCTDKIARLEECQVNTDTTCDDLKKNVEFHDTEIVAMRAEIESYKDLKVEVATLKKENVEFKIYKEAAEQQHRKYNLWFYGIHENDPKEHVWTTIKHFCIKVLGQTPENIDTIYIKNVHRVGDTKVKDRPIIVVFSNWDDRQFVLRAAGKLYSYNQANGTKFSVKTDLAPLARAKRKQYYGVSNRMKADTGLQVKVCDNEKGRVWLASRKDENQAWKRVEDKEIKPKWLNPSPTTAPVTN